jgi:hypothetical protein
MEKGGRCGLSMNYSFFFCAILSNILEMADVETTNNLATPTNDISNYSVVKGSWSIESGLAGIKPPSGSYILE